MRATGLNKQITEEGDRRIS